MFFDTYIYIYIYASYTCFRLLSDSNVVLLFQTRLGCLRLREGACARHRDKQGSSGLTLAAEHGHVEAERRSDGPKCPKKGTFHWLKWLFLFVPFLFQRESVKHAIL